MDFVPWINDISKDSTETKTLKKDLKYFKVVSPKNVILVRGTKSEVFIYCKYLFPPCNDPNGSLKKK